MSRERIGSTILAAWSRLQHPQPTTHNSQPTTHNSRRLSSAILAAWCGLGLSGCSEVLDTSYGRSRGHSINGTGVFAALLRKAGHTVESTRRLEESPAERADIIARFAPYPGLLDGNEANWYYDWLLADGRRRLIYVPRDYDAEPEYWTHLLNAKTTTIPAQLREAMTRRRDDSSAWHEDLPEAPENSADPDTWFDVTTDTSLPTICQTLEGPWAEGIDAKAAALTRRHTLEVWQEEEILLEGNGEPLAMHWHWENGSSVLVVANGSFLLNATLVNPSRRLLASRAVSWLDDGPARVVFVEGGNLLGAPPGSANPFRLLSVPPFGLIAAHLGVMGLVVVLAYAIQLGQARVPPSAEVEQPSAHARALGGLLARTRDVGAALAQLEAYRRWRHPTSPTTPSRSVHPY